MNPKELYVPILILWIVIIFSITQFDGKLSAVLLVFAAWLYAGLIGDIIDAEKTDENKKVPISIWRSAFASPFTVPLHALFIGLPDALSKRN